MSEAQLQESVQMREIPEAIRKLQAMSYQIRLKDNFWCVFRSDDELRRDDAVAREREFVKAVQSACRNFTEQASRTT